MGASGRHIDREKCMSEIGTLDGPRFGPASGGPAKQLVIMLHGVGADGADLIGLAPHFAQVLPDAAFVAPNAPYPYDSAPMGYQWFSVLDRTESVAIEGVQTAAPILHRFIDDELAKLDLKEDSLALIGFSQGTVMSLYVAPRRELPVAGILGYSGRLVGPERMKDEIRVRPPVLLIHGVADPVLPFEAMASAEQGLRACGIPVETMARPGLGNGIDEEGALRGLEFLKTCFGE